MASPLHLLLVPDLRRVHQFPRRMDGGSLRAENHVSGRNGELFRRSATTAPGSQPTQIGSWVSVIGHTAMIAAFAGTSNKVGQGAGIAFLFLFVTFFATGVDVST